MVERLTPGRARWFDVGAAAVALAAGLALARAPVIAAAAALAGSAVGLAVLVEPLVGLGLTLMAGPFAALERIVWGLPLDLGQALLMLTLGAWLLRGSARRRVFFPRAPLTMPLLAFTGVAAISLWNAFSVADGLAELLKWVQVIAVYVFVVDSVDRARLPWATGMVLAAALVQACGGLWQFGLRGAGPEHFLIPGTSFYRAYGGFEQPNPFAGYIGLALPLAVGLVSNFKLVYTAPRTITLHVSRFAFPLLAGVLILAAALLASWSRGAWLGAAAALAVMIAFWPRRWWLGVGLVSIIAAVILGGSVLGVLPQAVRARLADLTQYAQVYDVRGVGVNDANYAVVERLAHWQAAGEMIRWRAWTGVGFGNYQAAYDTYRLLKWPIPLGHAHNYILNIAAETGIPGLLAYLFLWGAIFWQTFRALGKTSGWRRGLVLGLLGAWVHLFVHNMVDNLYVNNVWIHLAVLLGLLNQASEHQR